MIAAQILPVWPAVRHRGARSGLLAIAHPGINLASSQAKSAWRTQRNSRSRSPSRLLPNDLVEQQTLAERFRSRGGCRQVPHCCLNSAAHRGGFAASNGICAEAAPNAFALQDPQAYRQY